MAEALIEVVLENLSSLVQKELGLFLGFDQDLKSLSSLLTTIKATLEDAEEKQFTDRAIKDWLHKLKDAAHILDDILDDCSTRALELEYEGLKGGPSGKGKNTSKSWKEAFMFAFGECLSHGRTLTFFTLLSPLELATFSLTMTLMLGFHWHSKLGLPQVLPISQWLQPTTVVLFLPSLKGGLSASMSQGWCLQNVFPLHEAPGIPCHGSKSLAAPSRATPMTEC